MTIEIVVDKLVVRGLPPDQARAADVPRGEDLGLGEAVDLAHHRGVRRAEFTGELGQAVFPLGVQEDEGEQFSLQPRAKQRQEGR